MQQNLRNLHFKTGSAPLRRGQENIGTLTPTNVFGPVTEASLFNVSSLIG